MNDLILRERIEGWQKLKTRVLDSVSSPIANRVYNMAPDQFMIWFQQELRPGFTKVTVNAWRASLEARKFGSSSVIIRTPAICKPGAERRPRPRKTREIALFLAVLLGCGADGELEVAPLTVS